MKKNVLNLLNDFRMRWIGAGLFMIVAIAAAYEKGNYTFSLSLLGDLFPAYIFAYLYYGRYTDDERFIILFIKRLINVISRNGKYIFIFYWASMVSC